MLFVQFVFVQKDVFCVYLLIRAIRVIRVRFLFHALLNIRVISEIRVRLKKLSFVFSLKHMYA